jgi:hypothetical protein
VGRDAVFARQTEAGVMEYLRSQTEAVDKDCIHGVRARPSPEGAPPRLIERPIQQIRERLDTGSLV